MTLRAANLHGGVSYVVTSTKARQFGSSGPSDELEIYDLVGDRLRPRFDFRPSATDGEAWGFRLDGVEDLQSSGEQDVVGGFFQLIDSGGTNAIVPVVVSWDDATQKYDLQPLLPVNPSSPWGPPVGSGSRWIGVGGALWWAFETTGVPLRDPQHGISIDGYGGADFLVEPVTSFRTPGTTAVVVLVVVVGGRDDQVITHLSGWILNPSLTPVTTAACPAKNPHVQLTGNDNAEAIRAAYGASWSEC